MEFAHTYVFVRVNTNRRWSMNKRHDSSLAVFTPMTQRLLPGLQIAITFANVESEWYIRLINKTQLVVYIFVLSMTAIAICYLIYKFCIQDLHLGFSHDFPCRQVASAAPQSSWHAARDHSCISGIWPLMSFLSVPEIGGSPRYSGVKCFCQNSPICMVPTAYEITISVTRYKHDLALFSTSALSPFSDSAYHHQVSLAFFPVHLHSYS